MHRHDPGVLELVEHLKAVGRGLSVVAHGERLRLRVDGRDLTDVAVIDARSGGRTVRVFEHDVIVIADLHDAVALAKDGLAEAPLLLLGRRRVERRLQAHIQCRHAGVILARRREHLNVGRRDLHIVRQPRPAQLDDRVGGLLRIRTPEEEEVPAVLRKVRVLTAVDRVRVGDDAAAGGLTEDLRQAHGRHDAAADDVRKDVARSNGRKLVGIAHEDEPALRAHGAQQRAHERNVNHGALVEDDGVALERVVLVAPESDVLMVVAHAGLEQAVDRLRAPAGQLAHALGGAPGRGGELRVELEHIKQRQDRADGGRLACAGAAGDGDDLMLAGEAQRLLLLVGKGQAELRFNARGDLLCVRHAAVLRLRHGKQALGRVGLRLVQTREIASVAPGDALAHQFAALHKRVHALGDQPVRHAAELRRRRQQVAVRDEAMAAHGVIGELIQRRRGDTLCALIVKPVAERQRVRLLKCCADGVRNEYVRVVLHELERIIPVILVHPQGNDRADVRRGQKLDQAAHTGLTAEICRHGLGLGETDAFDRAELFRLVFEHVERVGTEARHHQ